MHNYVNVFTPLVAIIIHCGCVCECIYSYSNDNSSLWMCMIVSTPTVTIIVGCGALIQEYFQGTVARDKGQTKTEHRQSQRQHTFF